MMADSNNFKIHINQPVLTRLDILRPTSAHLKAPVKKQKSLYYRQQHNLQLNLPHLNPIKAGRLSPQRPIKHQKNADLAEQSTIMVSYRSVSSARSYRKVINCDPKPASPNKLNRPQTAMLKKAHKKSWEYNSTRTHIFKREDLIFKKQQDFSKLDNSIAFLKEKCSSVLLIKKNKNLDCDQSINKYILKLYGKIQIEGNNYYIVKNMDNLTIRNVMETFGLSKQSLVKQQIRNLISGIMHCHNRGIVHNRLNIDTLLMSKDGSYFFIDFVRSSHEKPSQEQKGKYFHFFAPQLLNYGVITESCDVWAIGCITLYLLTGNVTQNIMHPYNEQFDASPSSGLPELKKLRQQQWKYMKKNQKKKQGIFQNKLIELSKSAKSFISACLKFNHRARPELSLLTDHDFLLLKVQR